MQVKYIISMPINYNINALNNNNNNNTNNTTSYK